mgnify:CR=1 FL=1
MKFSTSSPIHQWAPGQSLLPALCTLFHLPQVLVNLNDINDNCPTFPRPYEGPFDVTEGQPGPRIWTFLAHDGDSGPGGQVEYSIIAGDPLGEQGRGVLAPKLCARSSGMAPSLLPRLTREHGMQPTLMEKMGSPSFFSLFCGKWRWKCCSILLRMSSPRSESPSVFYLHPGKLFVLLS